MPKCRQVRATLREDSPARCNTLNRQVHNRVCSVFVIASPCRESRQPKTPLTLPSLWTHRTRPQGTWKLQNSFHSANNAHHLFEKDFNPNRRESQMSTLSWDFTTSYKQFKSTGFRCVAETVAGARLVGTNPVTARNRFA